MLAFACNRRHSGLQLQNSITFLSCGVTHKANNYLHFLGLTSSRKTALQAMETLKKATEEKIKDIGSRSFKIRPLWCLDNLDIEARVHDKRVEANSKVFHGTWGYLHEVPEHLTEDLTPEDLDLNVFSEAFERSKVQKIDMRLLIPTMAEELHFELAQKSQIATALVEHCLEGNSQAITYCKRNLPLCPPEVDPIQMYDPKITMFKLMSASDNSSTGIGQLIEQVLSQLGVDSSDFGKWFQIVEGDMGTNMNFEGATRKRYPAGHAEEGLQNLSFGLAGAHTMWNFESAIVSAYAGDINDSEDPGIARCAAPLGIKPEKLVDKSDYGLLMQTVKKIQLASFVFLLKYVLLNIFELIMAEPNHTTDRSLRQRQTLRILPSKELQRIWLTSVTTDIAQANQSVKPLIQMMVLCTTCG